MVTQVITLLYRTHVVCRFAVLRNCSHYFCGPPSTRMIHHPRESHQPSNASKSLPLVAKTFVEKTNRSSHMKQGEGKIDPLGKWKNIGRVEPLQKKDVQVKVDHLPTESHFHFWDEYFEKHVWNHQGVHFIGPNWETLSRSGKWDYMRLPHVDGHWSW